MSADKSMRLSVPNRRDLPGSDTKDSQPPTCTLRILIADDDPDARTILTDSLTHRGYEVWAACDGQQALALAKAHPVDVALLDVVMPGLSDVELISPLRSLQPGIVIILLTAYGAIPQAVEAIKLGAFDYLEKPLQPKRVRAAIERAWAARQASVLTLGDLTRREREVARLLAEGKTNAEIAEALCISVYTAGKHVRNILTKLKAENRVQVALLWSRYVGETRP